MYRIMPLSSSTQTTTIVGEWIICENGGDSGVVCKANCRKAKAVGELTFHRPKPLLIPKYQLHLTLLIITYILYNCQGKNQFFSLKSKKFFSFSINFVRYKLILISALAACIFNHLKRSSGIVKFTRLRFLPLCCFIFYHHIYDTTFCLICQVNRKQSLDTLIVFLQRVQ